MPGMMRGWWSGAVIYHLTLIMLRFRLGRPGFASPSDMLPPLMPGYEVVPPRGATAAAGGSSTLTSTSSGNTAGAAAPSTVSASDLAVSAAYGFPSAVIDTDERVCVHACGVWIVNDTDIGIAPSTMWLMLPLLLKCACSRYGLLTRQISLGIASDMQGRPESIHVQIHSEPRPAAVGQPEQMRTAPGPVQTVWRRYCTQLSD